VGIEWTGEKGDGEDRRVLVGRTATGRSGRSDDEAGHQRATRIAGRRRRGRGVCCRQRRTTQRDEQ
jgi:hypothetical protein